MMSGIRQGKVLRFFRSFSFFVIFSLCFVLACGLAGYRGKSIYASILAENAAGVNRPETKSPPLIILDPGHGGIDAGAVGIDGLLEKNLNLTIAMQLRNLLQAGGYEVLMTREEDVMLGEGDPGRSKMQDLRFRLNLAKQHPDAILVSIHMNKFPEASCHGLTVYYSGNRPESQDLGAILKEKNQALLQPENQREMKKATSAIYLLNRLPIPGVLVECGFLSNPSDAENLQKEEYQRRLALVLAGGIHEYLTAAQSGSEA